MGLPIRGLYRRSNHHGRALGDASSKQLNQSASACIFGTDQSGPRKISERT